MRVRVSKNPFALVVAGFVVVLNLVIGFGMKLPFIPSVGESMRQFTQPLVCPDSSTLKVYSSSSTWRDSDGLTHNGTGYSFDCVNSSGRHVDNHIDLYFGLGIVSIIMVPFIFIIGIALIRSALNRRQMAQVN
jgi:hypothetical protein